MGRQEKQKKKNHHLSYRGVTIAVEGRVPYGYRQTSTINRYGVHCTVRYGTSTVLCTRAARQADLPAQVLYPIRQLVAVSIVHTYLYPTIPYTYTQALTRTKWLTSHCEPFLPFPSSSLPSLLPSSWAYFREWSGSIETIKCPFIVFLPCFHSFTLSSFRYFLSSSHDIPFWRGEVPSNDNYRVFGIFISYSIFFSLDFFLSGFYFWSLLLFLAGSIHSVRRR